MITVTGRGMYWLINKPMLLMLVDGQDSERVQTQYHLVLSQGLGTINLIPDDKFNFTIDAATGRFRMYGVRNEQSFKDGIYLELNLSMGKWSCYVLPTGLPDQNIFEKEILVSKVCITKTVVKD